MWKVKCYSKVKNMPKKIIFFDDGGVLNDNYLRGEQWKELLVKFLVPRFGGDPNIWKETNQKLMQMMSEIWINQRNSHVFKTYREIQDFEDTMWVEGMFDPQTNIKKPTKSEYYSLCREVEEFVAPKCSSSFPGVIAVIKKLFQKNYKLYTASGENSLLLKGYLTGMGVLDCFINLYGPDIIGISKGSKEYYETIFEHAKVSTSDVIVIDDSSSMLDLVTDLGATPIHCLFQNKNITSNFKYSVKNAPELFKLLESIT
jgi:phosphoglycolate phosphatase-like HAD superfamily hydrolase